MLPKFVTVHRRAWNAYDQLSKAQVKSLANTMRLLHQLPRQEWEQHGVLPRSDGVYRIGWTDTVLVLFSVQADGSFVIEDFAGRERPDAHASAKSGAKT